MLVSAISANRPQSVFTNNYNFVNSRGGDTTDSKLGVFSSKQSTVNAEMMRLYDSINEWKTFCHRQMDNGKLDVIA